MIDELCAEALQLVHHMSAAAEAVHKQGEASGARRGILRSLARGGPQTVPQLARARPVSRQFVQLIVNALQKDGLAETIDNPAHKRSKLVKLTGKGERLVGEMDALEARVLGELPVTSDEKDIRTAIAVLRDARNAFADPGWKARAEALVSRRRGK